MRIYLKNVLIIVNEYILACIKNNTIICLTFHPGTNGYLPPVRTENIYRRTENIYKGTENIYRRTKNIYKGTENIYLLSDLLCEITSIFLYLLVLDNPIILFYFLSHLR